MRKAYLAAVMLAALLFTFGSVASADQAGNGTQGNSTIRQSTYDNNGVSNDVYGEDAAEIRNMLRGRIKNAATARMLRERIREKIENQAERLALWAQLKEMCDVEEEAAATVAEIIYVDPDDLKNYGEFAKLWRKRHQEGVIVFVYGQKMSFDVPPQLVRARTLMPIRAIAEKLGADVDWDPKTRTITINKDDQTIVLVLDKPTARVNGKAAKMDVPPHVIRGRTMVPLRFVAENLGLNITYINEAQTVVIN